jgi:hypothetical protein
MWEQHSSSSPDIRSVWHAIVEEAGVYTVPASELWGIWPRAAPSTPSLSRSSAESPAAVSTPPTSSPSSLRRAYGSAWGGSVHDPNAPIGRLLGPQGWSAASTFSMSAGVLWMWGDRRILPARSAASTPAASRRARASSTESGGLGSRNTSVEPFGLVPGAPQLPPRGDTVDQLVD